MFEAFAELFNLVVTIFFRGGWIPLVAVLPWMIYIVYMDRIQEGWLEKQEWVFLKVNVPPENEKSPLAFEQVFNQLHSTQASITFAEKYLEGKFQIWFSWEIVSIAGKINNYVRCLTKHRDTLEAAIYSQFPEAEITETEDFFELLPKYDPDTSDFDIFAWSNVLIKEDAYPIRTYLDFEHSTADTFVDPVTGLWEALGKINEYEMFVIQYIFQPLTDDWKETGYRLVKKLKGEPQKKRSGLAGDILRGVTDAIFDFAIRSDAETTGRQKEEMPSLMLHLSEGEKNVISAVERNLSKLGYATKIHCLYLAPKAKFNYAPVSTAIVGAFKSLAATDLNSIKPATKRWTRVDYMLFSKKERRLVEFRVKWRKRKMMRFMRSRMFWHGPKPMILNTEEIATLLHFPQTDVTVPDIERVPVTKVKAPADLPISSDFMQEN